MYPALSKMYSVDHIQVDEEYCGQEEMLERDKMVAKLLARGGDVL